MKRYLLFILVFLSICFCRGYSQCADVYTDINTNPYVCGNYGDANGNSNWNWEITDKTDPNYCNMWYARTSSIGTKLTAMGSPFVDASTNALDLISQSRDFTKAKGWELLRRDFGCANITAYPYFVLYNKYSGLVRVFVYQPETQPQYSGIVLQIEPTKSPWPATTSLGDDLTITPDKYLSSNQAGNYGKMVIAVSEPGGSGTWSVAEFNPAFDPNIQNTLYTGTGLKFTIYGMLNSEIKATIKGRSVTSTDPKVYNFNYVPTVPPSSSDGENFNFKAEGEKFIKFAKSITEIRTKVNNTASVIINSLPNTSIFETSLLGRIKGVAFAARESSSSDEGFGKLLGEASTVISRAGNVLKFVNTVIGMFSGIDVNGTKPAPMPSYTSYDLVLNGTLTAKSVQQSFILRVPGTVQTNNDNATYYKCPLGIFNIKNTPEADTVVYTRVHEFKYSHCCVNTSRTDYISYKMRNNLQVSFNDGAGLDLVSVQAAIVGEVLPDANGNASYDLLAEHFYQNNSSEYYYLQGNYNYTRPDLEAGRLEMTLYDPEKKLHTFQTPYVNIECINGLTFNARRETKVFLRIKAILKKKNDPDNTPILYIRDYDIQEYQGYFDPYLRQRHNTAYSSSYPTPYSNYTELPTYTSDKTISGITYNQTTEVKADNSITSENGVDVIVPSGQNVVYKAGSVISLQDGFHAQAGSQFEAKINTFGYNITCGTPSNEAFQYTGNCYNTSITALRTRTDQNKPGTEETDNEDVIKVYPIPTNGNLIISGVKNYKDAVISIIDQSGRSVREIKSPVSENGESIKLDVSGLSNGVYFIKLQSANQILSRKIVINK